MTEGADISVMAVFRPMATFSSSAGGSMPYHPQATIRFCAAVF
jgi:hypothetical protein